MIAEWSGPAWAAPESAERIRTGTEVSPPGADRLHFGALCCSLAERRIDADAFRRLLTMFARGKS